jgi:hypothetical protein
MAARAAARKIDPMILPIRTGAAVRGLVAALLATTFLPLG